MSFDQNEINKFNNLAHEWWDVEGKFKTLHQVNPVRTSFIQKHTPLKDQKLLDVGCGGGILAEALANLGATVSGIDLAPQSIEVAQLHLYESKLNIDYVCTDIDSFATQHPESFDIITCMEMLEHVPDPDFIISRCNKLLKPGGIAFFSTLNRNLKSYALGVIVAEYILKLLPKGTHEYQKFIKPSELSSLLRHNAFDIMDITGISYNPFNNSASLTSNTDINYIIVCKKS